jgi:hypothetical protein
MRTHTRINLIWSIICLILIIQICSKKQKNKNYEKLNYEYKTDTLYLNRSYVLPKPKGIKTNPKKITFYQKENSNLKLNCSDSILTLIDTIQNSDTILINPNFLKLYSTSPKLLNLELKKDFMNITLFDINSQVYTQEYPINLNQFEYSVNEKGELSRVDLNYKPPYNFSKGLFAGVEYRVIQNVPLVFINYDYPIKSIQSSIGLATFYENKPNLELFIRLRKQIRQ